MLNTPLCRATGKIGIANAIKTTENNKIEFHKEDES
jgi:hypothetical protein